jgi:hypothetical protein
MSSSNSGSPNHLSRVDPHELELWKCSIPNDDNLKAALHPRQFDKHRQSSRYYNFLRLIPTKKLSLHFQNKDVILNEALHGHCTFTRVLVIQCLFRWLKYECYTPCQ